MRIPVERRTLRLPCFQQAIQHLQFLRFSIQLISPVGLDFTRVSGNFLMCPRYVPLNVPPLYSTLRTPVKIKKCPVNHLRTLQNSISLKM